MWRRKFDLCASFIRETSERHSIPRSAAFRRVTAARPRRADGAARAFDDQTEGGYLLACLPRAHARSRDRDGQGSRGHMSDWLARRSRMTNSAKSWDRAFRLRRCSARRRTCSRRKRNARSCRSRLGPRSVCLTRVEVTGMLGK